MFEFTNYLIAQIVGYLLSDWAILLIGILIAAGMKVFVAPEKINGHLLNGSKWAVPISVGLGSLTPLCACGTMAVIISLFLSRMTWGPVMAFLISSPLTSPSEFFFEGSIMGWDFATKMTIFSIILGLGAGLIATLLEKKTHYFDHQFRIESQPFPIVIPNGDKPCCQQHEQSKMGLFIKAVWETGFKKILFYFLLFIMIGKSIEYFIPQDFQLPLLGADNPFSVIIGASIGLPLYINYASALPLLKSLVNAGGSEGAILAFLIAGKQREFQ